MSEKSQSTVIEITLRIGVGHDEGDLDENSIKAMVNEGMKTIADNVDILGTISDGAAGSICVSPVKLKINGKRRAISTFGTDAIPWGRD
jgi:hypothetical protein